MAKAPEQEVNCEICRLLLNKEPEHYCTYFEHWKAFAAHMKSERDKAAGLLAMHDSERDKLDVADWLVSYEKTHSYDCSGCGRHYIVPTHLTRFNCVCGASCRLRHVGGINPDQAVIDSAIRYFGTERMAQLAYIAELIVSKHMDHYSADSIRGMISEEIDRWELSPQLGWQRKEKRMK
jgi:hypothetical protein